MSRLPRLRIAVLFLGLAALLQAQFPSITTTEFDPSANINSALKGYQLAAFDAARNQVLFFPWGQNPASTPVANGNLLVYNAALPFGSTSAYSYYNLPSITGVSTAAGFCGGALDEPNSVLYLSPGFAVSGSTTSPSGEAVRVDLTQNLSNSSAYQEFNISSVVPAVGAYCPAVVLGGNVYFVPTGNSTTNNPYLLVYNESLPFTSSSSWSYYNLTNVNAAAEGFESYAVVGNNLYLVPYFNTIFVVYNTTQSLTSSASYTAYDLTNVLPLGQRQGLTGAVVVNSTQIVMIPWANPSTLTSTHYALLYDTTQSFTSSASYTDFDLTTVNSASRGYEFGWLDRNGFCWFVPNYNSVTSAVPPLINWNTSLPFASASSWTSYTNSGIPPSTGAAYNSTTNTAWLSPYGSAASSNYSITQVGTNSPGGTIRIGGSEVF